MALIIIWISLEQYLFLNSDSLLDPLVELLMSHIGRQKKKHLSTINTPIPILKFAIQFTVSFLEEVTVHLTYSLSSVAIRQLHQVFKASSQLAFTCSKLTKRSTRTRFEICSNDPNGVVLVSLLLTLTYFTPSSSVFIVNSEHVIVNLTLLYIPQTHFSCFRFGVWIGKLTKAIQIHLISRIK